MTAKAYSYIRFSTPEQLKGDSLRRQKEASEKYCKENKLKLDESFRDLGTSGYHGINKTKGALGEFLNLIRSGKINKGSVLIIENLDRLSRQDVLTALNLFTSIIEAGITIVTLHDGMKYSKESVTDNWAQLIISITYMARAHNESETKSKRHKINWEQKRIKALKGEKKMTARCPEWLYLSEDRKKFIPIDVAVQIINQIFDMKLEGKGKRLTAKLLNQSDCWKPQSRRMIKGKLPEPRWRDTYITKILRNRAVIGEYQPCKKVDGKRVPEGDVIPDYYPMIITEEKFNRVQGLIYSNDESKGHGGGRNGNISNLFGGLLICSECRSPMILLNKGKPPKGQKYLQCDKSYSKLGCTAKEIRYDLVEYEILSYCEGLDASVVLPSSKAIVTEENELRIEIQAINGEIPDLIKKIDNAINETINPHNSDNTKKRFRETVNTLEARLTNRTNELKEKETKLKELESKQINIEEQLKSMRELITKMIDLSDEERLNIRLNLRNQLRNLIEVIKINTKLYGVFITWKGKKGAGMSIDLRKSDEADQKVLYRGPVKGL